MSGNMFSMDQFKKWLSEQDQVKETPKESPLNKFVGHMAHAKVSRRKLLEKIEEASNDEFELIEEFRNEGGQIYDVNGAHLCIETDGGTFEIPRFCVKIVRDA
jgi:hypothetical protein